MVDEYQPKLRSYCAAFYERMVEESNEEDGLVVWRGYITKTIRGLGIPDGTYKRITDKLQELGSVEQVERGFRGNKPSVMILNYPPTDEVWDRGESGRQGLTGPPSAAILARRVNDLERRLEGLNIKEALVDMQQQIRKLQTAIQGLSDNNNSNT